MLFRSLRVEGSLVRLSVTVSSGTYIRSLAHDIGARLGLGAHLSELRRTALGSFTLADASKLESLENPPALAAALRPLETLLPELPGRQLTWDEVRVVLHGRAINAPAQGEWLRLLTPDGQLAGLARADGPGWYHPEVVLAEAVPAIDESNLKSPAEQS